MSSERNADVALEKQMVCVYIFLQVYCESGM